MLQNQLGKMACDISLWQGVWRREGERKGRAKYRKQKLLFKIKDQISIKMGTNNQEERSVILDKSSNTTGRQGGALPTGKGVVSQSTKELDLITLNVLLSWRSKIIGVDLLSDANRKPKYWLSTCLFKYACRSVITKYMWSATVAIS